MRHFIFLVLIAASSDLMSIHITVRDYIRYEGRTLAILNSPLEPYFDLFPDLRPYGDCFQMSKCYRATYEIRDSKLYLIKLDIFDDTYENDTWHHNTINVISEVFDNKEEVLLDWLSTTLVVDLNNAKRKGEFIKQRRLKYLKVRIEDGIVVRERKSSEWGFKRLKKKLFRQFKKTDSYESIRKYYNRLRSITSETSDTKRWSHSKMRDIVIDEKILDYTSKIDSNKTFHKIN
jgi:hypothetical protein